MRVTKITIRNFRSVLEEMVEFDVLTALVGRNGSGKSTLLRALELFFAPTPKFDLHDFYADNVNRQIEIEVTFSDLRPEEQSRFAKYVQSGTLTVMRILSMPEGKSTSTYHGQKLTNPDFQPIRSATKAGESKSLYDELRKTTKYQALPPAGTIDARREAMSLWEDANPAECSMSRDDGQFFGFKEVLIGYLGKFTKFIPIPAVRDASAEAEEGRGSAVTELIDLVVRGALLTNKDIQDLKESSNQRYREIIDPSKLSEMRRLEGDLTSSLKTFVPDASLHLSWLNTGGVDIQMPKADVTLTEDGYRCPVTRTGHGLQRAFILTMLQYLATAVAPPEALTEGSSVPSQGRPPAKSPDRVTMNEDAPDIILAIEEPELYQHPSRQRHFATVLRHLALGKSVLNRVARNNQIIYSTHSPAFVGVDRFDQIRLFRKQLTNNGGPRITKVANATLSTVASALWDFHNRPRTKFTAETLSARLHPLMTPWMNEGFFADLVVLVEGEEDRAAVLGVAKSMGHDLDSIGVSVIPCDGKTNLDRATLIFDSLGISVYIIWDSDHESRDPNIEYNRCLLRIVKSLEEDYPDKIEQNYACFKTKLGHVMKNELGPELYESLFLKIRAELGFQEKSGEIKNPIFIHALIDHARQRGKTFVSMEKIVNMILEKRHGPSVAYEPILSL